MVPQGKLLRHIAYKEGLKPNPNKIKVIMEMEEPKDVTGVKSFLARGLL